MNHSLLLQRSLSIGHIGMRRSVAGHAGQLALMVLAALALVVAGSASSGLISADHGGYHLLVSDSPDRSSPQELEGATVSGDMYVFVIPESGVRSPGVTFWINDPDMATDAEIVEGRAPFDLAGTAPDGSALPFDMSALGDGSHSITAHVQQPGTAETVLTSTFSVEGAGSGPDPALTFTPSSLSFSLDEGGSDSADVTVDASDGSTAAA
ncbi:MAG: hypothetical protein WD848_08210, partial [Dehalococcoidia bacterium]